MIDLGPHAAFILWGYGGVAIAMLAVIGWTVLSARRVEKRLAELEASGARRRSGPAA